MPDLGQWIALLLLTSAAAVAIAWPLRPGARLERGPSAAPMGDDRDVLELRHRVALEALRDVEADRRAGSLDDLAYARQRSEAEERAVRTLAELDAVVPRAKAARPRPERSRHAVLWLAGGLVVALLVGFALPGPNGLGQRTVVDEALANRLAAESERQAEIQRLLGLLGSDPRDPQVLSDLADAYLAGSRREDLQRAAVALQVLLAIEPQDRSAYRRLITAYISAGDWTDAQAATDSFAGIADPDDPDIPFFRGLIAFRSGDAAAAVRHFDRFLALAPEDDRVSMVSSLRAEAAGELDGAGASPGS